MDSIRIQHISYRICDDKERETKINKIAMHKESFVPVNIWREMTLILISKNMFPRGGNCKNAFRSCLQTCCVVQRPLYVGMLL